MTLPACWWKQSCPLSDLLLQVESLAKAFWTRGVKGASVKAVAGVSFTLRRGETLGLVGESGCGKSTLSRLILSLLDSDAGKVSIDEIDFTNSLGRAKREMRRRIQIVFQDALSSLNPRMTVGTNIAEPMRLQGLGSAASRRAEAQRLLGVVGLRPEHEDRYPHEFSGGQCQRIAIARALILKPEIIVFDEAVSALDVSIRAQILRLILDLQAMFGLSYVFVSHDLGVIKRICDRVAVMYMGQIVEIGPTDVVCREPRHPYTAALLSAIPIADPRRMRVADLGQIEGDTVGVAKPGSCAFEPRCPRRFEPCDKAVPVLLDVGPDHSAACYLNSPGTLRGTL
jgi:oligopeptide/dipeptide ABC transporter ATP-binding protein